MIKKRGGEQNELVAHYVVLKKTVHNELEFEDKLCDESYTKANSDYWPIACNLRYKVRSLIPSCLASSLLSPVKFA